MQQSPSSTLPSSDLQSQPPLPKDQLDTSPTVQRDDDSYELNVAPRDDLTSPGTSEGSGDDDPSGPSDSASTNSLNQKAKEREARFRALRARAVHPLYLHHQHLLTLTWVLLRNLPLLPISKKYSPSAGGNRPTPAPFPACNDKRLKRSLNLLKLM